MALGGGGLGTLTLYINADTSDFDQAISRIESKARAFGGRFSQIENGLDLAPTVDDSALTALNKHLDLKQRHFQQVGQFMQRSPLEPKVRTAQLEELKAELKEIADLQRQTAKQFENNPINIPRITISPRINNRTINEAPRVNTRITAPDLKLTGTVSPRVTVSNRLSNSIKNTTSAARGASASPKQASAELSQVESQVQRLEQTEISPRLDIEAIERYTKRISDLEAQIERLNEKQTKAAKEPGVAGRTILEASAKALPNAAEKVADGIGTGISQGLSQAIPTFAGKMGDAAASAIAHAVSKSITPAIKINTPEFKFQTSFTDIVRAGKELTGASAELKEAAKTSNRQSNPVMSFIGRVGGSILTGMGQGIGGRISTGIVSGIENKLELKFRDAAEAAVVVLADGLEEALGFQFKSVGEFAKAQAPSVFDTGKTSRKRKTPATSDQPETTIESAIAYLASQDDGAIQKDGKGFNKLDTRRGQRLAEKIKAGQQLTQEEAKSALQMLQKYRKQLAEAQQGSLPEWEKIEGLYAQTTQAQPSPAVGQQEEIMAQLEQLKAQLKAIDNATSPEQVQQTVEEIQKAEVQLQAVISDKQQELIESMMSAKEITMSVLKPIGRDLGLPNINKARKDGGYSKEELIKEIVGKSDPSKLRQQLPFISVPVSPEVVAESEARATMSPEKLKQTLAAKRKTIAASLSRDSGQKTGNNIAEINNVIEREKQIITNLLSRDLSNTAKRYLNKQAKELEGFSNQLVAESVGTTTSAPTANPVPTATSIPDPWLDVDQMRSQAAATRSAFEVIGDAIGAFVDGLGGYASQITQTIQKVLGSLGGMFSASNPFAQSPSEATSTQPADPNAYKPKDVKDGLPQDVDVSEKDKKRTYDFKTKSGKKVKVTFKEEGKNQSEISFAVDGSFGNKSESMTPKERDAASLKIFKILKHDAKTRKDGHQYRGVAYDLDGYGAVRAYAYQKVGNLTRPERGIVGMSQYGVTKGGKVVPDVERLQHQERHVSPEAIRKNIQKAEERMQRERDRQKSRNEAARPASVDQMRSYAVEAQDTLDILGNAIATFAERIAGLVDGVTSSLGAMFGNTSKTEKKEGVSSNAEYYEAAFGKIAEQAAKQSGLHIKPEQMPKLEFNDEHLKRVGGRAQYNIKDNKLIVSSDVKKFFDALRSGAVNLNKYEQEIKDVAHELRHAFQYDFGKLNQGALMSGVKAGVMTPFSQTSSAAQKYGKGEASSPYYQQFAKQASDPEAFLRVIRDTEADAENFAEQWKGLIQAAFSIDESGLEETATNAAQSFVENILSLTQGKQKQAKGQQGFTVAQNRGVSASGAIGANPKLKQGLDQTLDSFNQIFDTLKTFESAVTTVVGSGKTAVSDSLEGIERAIEDVKAQIAHSANNMSQDGAAQTVEALDKLENQLDAEVENLEKFFAYVRQRTGGRANPALDVVQNKFNAQVSGVRANIQQSRNEAAIHAGIIQPPSANQDPPKQLNKFQSALEAIRKIARNVREELKAISSGEDMKARFVRGAAADLGIDLDEEQSQKVAGANISQVANTAQQVNSVAQAALRGSWQDVFEEMLDEIDEFTDEALDRFAEFVEGIPGGNVFAKVIRGAKEFKGVIFSFVGLKMAFDGLMQVKQWLDSFDEVFVDAAVSWEKFEKLIGFSSKTFNQAQSNIKFIRDEAIRLNTDLKQSMTGFSQLSAASIDTGLQGEGTKQIFGAVNQAGATYGLNGEESGRVYTAIGQMISKNTVSSEELKQQLGEVLPGSFQMAARAAGKTTQEFTQLLETGQILAEDFLPKFAQQLSAETATGAAGAANSAQAATNRFNNALLELQVSLGKFGIDERNFVLNTMAKGMTILKENATLLSYVMGSTLFKAVVGLKDAFSVFAKRLTASAAGFLMTRLGVTSLGAAMKALIPITAAMLKNFILFTVIMDGFAMLQAAMKDSSGKSREFATSLEESLGKVQESIAAARGEMDKFAQSQDKAMKRETTLLDEAPFLSYLMPKEIKEDDNILKKIGFGVGKGVSGGIVGTQKLLGIQTYEEKKRDDQRIATSDLLQGGDNTLRFTQEALGGQELAKVKQYDEQLRNIQLKRRGITQINPGDKDSLDALKREEDKILVEREKAFKPLGAVQSSNQIAIQGLKAEIEKYKEMIATTEPGEQLDEYKVTLSQLESSLKSVETAQNKLSKSIGESLDKFILLQKQLQNVVDRLADANDRIQQVGTAAKTSVIKKAATGEITRGQSEFAQQQIDQSMLEEQLKRKNASANEMQALLDGADLQKMLESRGVKSADDIGVAELNTLAGKAKEGTPEKEAFTRLAEVKKMRLEATDLENQLAQAQANAQQQIKDANKQIGDYFRDVSRQAAELALSTKEAQAQIALQQQKNKLKSALQGFQDNFFSSFVDSLIEGMDSINEPIMANIEKEREIQSANFAEQDRDRQTSEIYKSLPLQTQQIKLDFSGLDGSPVKELKTNLQESAKASKDVTEAAKGTGTAIAKSADEAKGLESNVGDTKDSVEGVKSATENVTSALQDNMSKAQEVNSQLQTNRDTTDTNRTATEAVTDAVGQQTNAIFDATVATEQATQTTGVLGAAWQNVGVELSNILAQTWEWFQGLGKNVPFINQFGELIAGWGKNIQDLIAKTWEWLQGLGNNIPFLQQIGQTIGGWGQGLGNAISGAGNAVQGALGLGGDKGYFRSGLYTGESSKIGGSSSYHIDTKIAKSVGKEMAVQLVDQIAKGYEEAGKRMEFSNAAVSGLVWDINASFEEKAKMLDRVDKAHSHSPNPGYWDMDYYIPDKNEKGRSGASTKGAEMILPTVQGGQVQYASGGGYGHFATIKDSSGKIVLKTGHGDNTRALPKSRKFESPVSSAISNATDWLGDRASQARSTFGMNGKSKVVMRRTGQKDEHGLEQLALNIFDKQGNVTGNYLVNSGVRRTQNKFGGGGTTSAGSLAPVEYGNYRIGGEMAGQGAGVGSIFIPVNPTFKTGRSSIGFHVDANRSTAPGSAGCIVFKSQAEFDEFRKKLKESGAKEFSFESAMASVGATDSTSVVSRENAPRPAQQPARGGNSRFTMPLPTGGNLRSGAGQNVPSWMPKMSWDQHRQFLVNQAMAAGMTDPNQIKYLLATAEHETGKGNYMREGGSAKYLSYLNNKLGNRGNADAVAYRGAGYSQLTGKSNYEKWSPIVSKHFGQNIDLVKNPDLAAHPDIAAFILAKGMKEGSITGRGIGQYINTGAGKVDFRNARRTINGISSKQLVQIDKVLAGISLDEVKNRMAKAQSGGGGAMPSPTAMAQQTAQSAPVPILAPVPFASMTGSSGTGVGATVNTGQLSAAQDKSRQIKRQQEQQAIKKEQARVEQAAVEGEERQRKRLEQLRQSLMEQSKNRTQLNRQFRDLGLDAQIQTPDIEAMRKKTGINDQFDDLKLTNEEDIRKTTAARDQAKALLSKLTAPDYVAQPGQDVSKDVNAAKQAIASAEGYLKDLTRVQGDIENQRKAHLKFQNEQEAREKALREKQEKFNTEEVDISVLEAQAQKLKDMQSRGIRDQGVENLPKLEATIAARREELSLNQKLSEIDEKIRNNSDNQTIVGELNKQKAGLQERLKVVKETISANREYAETVAGRENEKRAREQANELARGELSILKQRLEAAQAIGQINPLAPEAIGIPEMEKTIALKEAELSLSEQIAAIEDKRFSKELTDEAADKRIADLKAENALTVENINKRAERAAKEQEFARRRAEVDNRSQDAELKGSVSEALARNIEYGRSQGDPMAMRYETQKSQQAISFERQMLELDELEASGKRTKEEIDALREAYTKLNEISLSNLAAEQQRATEDRVMEISGRMMSSRNSVLGGKGDLLSSMGLDTQAREYRKVAAQNEQKQSYAQESLNLERFIAQMQLSNEQALELRSNLGAVNQMKMDQIENEFSTMNELMTGVQGQFESAFTSILDGSKSIGEAAMDFLKGIGSQLASMASKMITDELFGKILGKGNKNNAEKDAEAIGAGGFLGGQGNPLSQYSMMNPLPVVMTNAGALGGGGLGSLASAGMGGFASGDSFMSSVLGGGGSFFGESLFGGNNTLPVDIVSANDNVFSSITNGIFGILGGGSGGGGMGLGGIIGSVFSAIGGGGGGAAGGGLGGGLFSMIPSLLGGLFAEGGEIGKSSPVVGKSFQKTIADGLRKETAMTGRKSRLIIASDGEIVVPHKVVNRLTKQERAILSGQKSPPPASVPSFASGGVVGASMGSSISTSVQQMGGTTNKIEGSTVNIGENGNASKEDAAKLKALIDASVLDTIAKQRRPRGLLY